MKKMNVVTALAWGCLMVPSLLLASGCTWLGLACTQVGCEDGTSVSIRGFEASRLYEIELETEDETVLCTLDTSDAMARMSCDNDLYYAQIDEAYIELGGTPERVAITVRADGAVIAEDEARPDYHEVAPNGEACGPICERAEIPFEI